MRVVSEPPLEETPGRSGAVLLVKSATPDVSSTGIRERAARGLSLAGLVAPEVECHIGKHRLYHP
jgi:nicotinic acid mononucleotide adenylyltransferase